MTTQIKIFHGITKSSRFATTRDVFAFAKFAPNSEIEFVNALGPSLYSGRKISCDLAIVTSELLSLRGSPSWSLIFRKLKPILRSANSIAFFPQDDYTMNALLNKTFEFFPDSFVFTPLWEHGIWLYSKANQSKLRPWLTGFVDIDSLSVYAENSKPWHRREIEVGQRVTKLHPRYGSEGILKAEYAMKFQRFAKDHGVITDISVDESQMFNGKNWYQFLGNTKFVVGRMSGASLITRNSFSILRSNAIARTYADLPIEEVVKKIAGRQSERSYLAVSPRIFESAAMGNCQILEPANYIGSIQPWEDYVPLKRDFSNVKDVIHFIKNGNAQEIVDKSMQKLIQSEKFHQKTWIQEFYRFMGYQNFLEKPKVLINHLENEWTTNSTEKTRISRAGNSLIKIHEWVPLSF